ncbi:MAG: cupin domain-containing protein [Acidiferrobacterales bacterium]|nr:cupin domain-containing protein [Acidiferrobacterales bacterium]
MLNQNTAAETSLELKPAMQLKFEDLMTEQLQGTENTEVVVSITTVPPHTTLPKHWHPGEEFAYVLDGSFVLMQEGKADEYFQEGDVGKVPLKQVHTVRTEEESATILIFRVHELGQPGRILVEE